METWSRQSVIEACRTLEAEKIAAGNMLPLNSRDIRASASGPSMPTIETYVGNNDALQRELGRVTTGIALSWTTDEWTQNAHWARDVLAEEGVTYVHGKNIDRLASAGLMPGQKAISRVWGSVPAYRQATGIESRPLYMESRKWGRQEFLDNGRQFADFLGREIGFPIMPVQDHINEWSSVKVPAIKRITGQFGSLDNYQRALGFVTSAAIREWSDEDWRDNYQWLVDALEANGQEVTSVQQLLSLAGKLHIGPAMGDVERRWGTPTEYAYHVGFESFYLKRELSTEGLLRAAMNLAMTKKGRLTKNDLPDDDVLGITLVKRRFGGVGNLNLRLGIIGTTYSWPANVCLWWGATRFIPAERTLPTGGMIDRWSADDKGPSKTKLYREFNHSLDVYRQRLAEAYDWMNSQADRLGMTEVTNGRSIGRGTVMLALRRNPALFHPEQPLTASELDVFFRLSRAGTNLRLIGMLMDSGIPFANPHERLAGLAEELDRTGMLNSTTLKRLEHYIVGLAPPEVRMSWSDYIAGYRQNRKRVAA